MTSTDLYIQRLLETNPLRETLLLSIVQSLQLPQESRGLDAGCGIGHQAILLARAVGPRGHVTGLDILPELLDRGAEIVEKAGLPGRITFREGDVVGLPFEDESFDWVWSSDCIGYPAGDLTHILGEIVRVTRPGGSLFILGWSSQQFLPGHPLLEDRLNGTCSGYLPYLRDRSPEHHFMRAASWLAKAGLEDVGVRTFVGDVQAPLSLEERTALTSLFEMLWGEPQPEVSSEDWKEYRRLCSPASADFILDLPQYYGFFTYTMFSGRVVKQGGVP